MTYTYLTVEHVLEIHSDQIKQTGGSPGIIAMGALESALARPRLGYYHSLIEEATALLESLATNHPFLDGNKRVAFLATDLFLRLNGFSINCDADEANRFIRNILVYQKHT